MNTPILKLPANDGTTVWLNLCQVAAIQAGDRFVTVLLRTGKVFYFHPEDTHTLCNAFDQMDRSTTEQIQEAAA